MVRAGMKTALISLLAALACAAPATALADVQPYGTNDAGGFRNVLPPGEAGTDNAVQLAHFQAAGTVPPHFDRPAAALRRPALRLADAHPRRRRASTSRTPRSACATGDVESTESPRPGVTIVRDKQYGVPHIYGATDDDVEFGAGYAGAEDRLFLMDVLRHTGRAQLSLVRRRLAGQPRDGSHAVGDRALHRGRPAEADRPRAPASTATAGASWSSDVNAFVDGINAYVDAANASTRPSCRPSTRRSARRPTQWTLTDVIAEASLIGGIFGKGGGNEVRSALAAAGAPASGSATKKGRRAWADFR